MNTSHTTGKELEQNDLLQRLEAFELDVQGVSFPFSRRLQRENGWSRAYTLRVIREYKRFVYLAMTAGHPVTPPVDVDQAWHLHLTYTRSYWEHFCGHVLRSPLHHEPTVGGGKEQKKFTDWYGRTIGSYRSIFGEEPPSDIWTPPVVRLGTESRIRQVSERTHWIFRKPRLGNIRSRPLAPVLAAIVLALIVAGCATDGTAEMIVAGAIGGVLLLGFGISWIISRFTGSQKEEKKEGATGGADGGYGDGTPGYIYHEDGDGGYSGEGDGWNSDTSDGNSGDADSSSSSDSSSGDSGGDSGGDGGSGCSGCGGCGGS